MQILCYYASPRPADSLIRKEDKSLIWHILLYADPFFFHHIQMLVKHPMSKARGITENKQKAHFVRGGRSQLRYRGTTGAPHPDMRTVAKMAYDLCPQEIKNII